MRQNKIRSSNFELLRVVAMYMIIIFHIVWHTVNIQLTDLDSISYFNNGFFNNPSFFKKLFIINAINPFGITGNAIFILISGYFMVERKSIDLAKISKKLLLNLLFAVIILVMSSTVTHLFMPQLFIEPISITDINNQYWFIGYYLLIIVLASLFLNQYLNSFTKKQYVSFLFVIFSIVTFAFTGLLMENLTNTLRTLIAGIFLYSLGGYIKKYNPFNKIRTSALIFVWVIIYILIFISYYNITFFNIEKYMLDQPSKDFMQNILNDFRDYSFLVIVLGVSIFELFRRLTIRSSKIIYYLGSATITIYLLHDNPFFYSIWNTQDWITVLYYHPIVFIGKLLLWGLFVFVLGVIAHSIYLGIGKLCIHFKKIVFVT